MKQHTARTLFIATVITAMILTFVLAGCAQQKQPQQPIQPAPTPEVQPQPQQPPQPPVPAEQQPPTPPVSEAPAEDDIYKDNLDQSLDELSQLE